MSRGLFHSELLEHEMWCNRPSWLLSHPEQWPIQFQLYSEQFPEEEREICSALTVKSTVPLNPLDRNSTFTRLKQDTA